MKPVRLFLFLVVENFKIEYQYFKKKFKDFWRRAGSRWKSGTSMGAIIITTSSHAEFFCSVLSGMVLGASIATFLYSLKFAVMGDMQLARKLGHVSLIGIVCWIICSCVFNSIFQ